MIVIKPHSEIVNAVAFAPDGKLLATIGKDGRVMVWATANIADGRQLWEAAADEDSGSHTEFSPDGRSLYTCGDEGVLRVWDAATGKLRKELVFPSGSDPFGVPPTGVLTVTRDGRHVAWAGGYMGRQARIAVADTTRWKVRLFPGHHQSAIGILIAGPDGLLSGSADLHIRFWDWASGLHYRSLRLRGFVRGLALTEAGDRLVASCGKEIMLWEMARPREGTRFAPQARSILRGHTKTIACLAFSKSGATLASTAADGTLRLWDVATGTSLRVFSPSLGPLHWVAFAPDGLTLAFTSKQGHLCVLDLDD